MFPNIAGSRSCIDCYHIAGRTFSRSARRIRELPDCDAHPDMMPRPVLLVFRMISLHQLRHPLTGCVFCNECDSHPFAPDPLQIFHHYYEWVRPCFPIRAGNSFSHSLRWSGSGSCCLNTGCRTVSKQVSSVLIRGRLYGPVLTSCKISMHHRTVYFRSVSRTPRDSRALPFPETLTTSFLRMK